MKMPEDVKRMLDNQEEMHKQDRDVLFENEKFLIGVLQVVSAGSIVAALNQSEQFAMIVSAASFRWFLTLASVSLLVAIAAAFFKHQYKMWDVKTRAVKPLEKAKDKPPERGLALFINARNDMVCTLDFFYTYRDGVIVIATVLIAFFTFTLYRATNRLWASATEQGRDMKASIAEAARAADAMERSGSIAQSNLEHLRVRTAEQMRAYVCVKGGTIRFERNNTRPVAEVQIMNFGNTPAYNLRSWIHIWIEEHPLMVTLPIPEDRFAKTDSVWAPGNSIFMVIPKEPPVPPENVALLGTRQGTIYVYGRIEYRDIFGDGRWTNYRLIYGGPRHLRGENLQTDSAGNDTSES